MCLAAMIFRLSTAIALPVSLVVIISGCGADSNKETEISGMVFGPSPSEQVAMTFDPDDADKRREGVAMLSQHDWALREPYLKGYAILLRTDENASVRSAAVRALGKAKATDYLADIVNALSDKSPIVRWDAAVALDSIVGPQAVRALETHALEDASTDVRSACARALRHYRRQEVLQTLIRCLTDPEYSVRFVAHEALVELTGTDVGYESEDWTCVGLSVSPTSQPVKTKEPWWDRLGLREKWRQRHEKADSEEEGYGDD